MAEEKNLIEITHISKKFGDRQILSDISLEIEKGEIVSILGPSGCGKTTLLNLILGLTDATSGQLIYDGEDLSHVSMQKRGFTLRELEIPQHDRLVIYVGERRSQSKPDFG